MNRAISPCLILPSLTSDHFQHKLVEQLILTGEAREVRMTLKKGLKIRILPGRKGNRRTLGRRNSMYRGLEAKHCRPTTNV